MVDMQEMWHGPVLLQVGHVSWLLLAFFSQIFWLDSGVLAAMDIPALYHGPAAFQTVHAEQRLAAFQIQYGPGT